MNRIFREKCCDNCTSTLLIPSGRRGSDSGSDLDEALDFASDSRILLECVRACKGYYGLSTPVAVAVGSKSGAKDWLVEAPCFGKGKHKSKQYWMALGRALEAAGYIGKNFMTSFSQVCHDFVFFQMALLERPRATAPGPSLTRLCLYQRRAGLLRAIPRRRSCLSPRKR